MASLWVLAFDHEGRPVQFDTWLDDLQLYFLSDSKDSVSLFDLASGAATAPPATADSRLLLTYLFPELSAFATVEDLVSHLRASDARYRAAVPNEFFDKNPPPMDHFLSLDPTSLTVDLLEQHLLVAETSALAVGAARGTPCPPFFEGCPYFIRTGDRAGQTCGRLHTQHRCFSRLDDAWRAEFGDDVDLPRWADLLKSRIAIFDLDFDAILSPMYALSVSAEGDCYRCVPPGLGIAAAALGASESGTLPDTTPAEALHTFTLDSGASRCFFRDNTTLTPLPAPVPVRLADPSGGPVVARSSTVLPCSAVPSHSQSGLHLPLFSTNLVAASAQVSTSSQVAASCSCRLVSHQTLLWHHRLGHPSLPRLRGMHSRLLVSGLPRSLPPLPPSPAPPCLPCVEGRQRATPHSSSFPPTTAPLQTLLMDV
ncbi:unnamed protein product [Closterium sp. NIES-53]